MPSANRLFHQINRMSLNEIGEKFTFIGEGISRAVFAVNDKLVIKVAKGSEGFYQNRVEYYVYTHCGNYFRKYLCPILWFRPGMIVMPRAIPLSSLMSNKYLNISSIRPEAHAAQDLKHLSEKFYLFYEDIVSTSSWGMINNKSLLIDYGCTSEEGDFYFDNLFK